MSSPRRAWTAAWHDRPASVISTITTRPSSSFGQRIGQAGADQPLHGASRRRRIDAQRVGEVAHPPRRLAGEQIERVHLALLERIVAASEQVVAKRAPGAAPDLNPRRTDSHRELVHVSLAEIDGRLHGESRVQASAGATWSRTVAKSLWSPRWESNPRPTHYECVALPTELPGRGVHRSWRQPSMASQIGAWCSLFDSNYVAVTYSTLKRSCRSLRREVVAGGGGGVHRHCRVRVRMASPHRLGTWRPMDGDTAGLRSIRRVLRLALAPTRRPDRVGCDRRLVHDDRCVVRTAVVAVDLRSARRGRPGHHHACSGSNAAGLRPPGR